MKPRQLNLFADKKHFRELNARLQKEVKEIMRKQLPLFEEPKRREMRCCRP